MKIKKLWVSEYKNIKDQSFEFEDEPLITLLIGKNGLGKSNLIEAIVSILRQLDLAEGLKDLTTEPDRFFFEFEIEYISYNIQTKIIAKDQQLEIESYIGDTWEKVFFIEFIKYKNQRFLPQNVIVYYSGENKRIKQLFARHKSIREYKLKQGSDSENMHLGKFFYVEENYGELIFFLLWIFKNYSQFKEHAEELFSKFAEIEGSSVVELTICNPPFYKERTHFGVDKFQDSGYKFSERFWNLSGDVEKLVRILFDNQIVTAAPPMYRDEKESEVSWQDEFIVLNSLQFDDLAESLIQEFGTPIKVFDVLEAAMSIGIIYKISTEISKEGQTIQHDFSELSEGEQQLITILGLLLLTSEVDALYLFDEPDTHLNPNWQRDYARLLKRFNIIHVNSQIIVSTHSPLIVQSAEEADMFLFKRSGAEISIDKNSHKIHNWRLDQVLVSEYFGFDSARPPSLDDYMMLKEKILNKYPFDEQDERDLAKFENDFGVLPTGETKTEIKALQLMNHLVKPKNDQD